MRLVEKIKEKLPLRYRKMQIFRKAPQGSEDPFLIYESISEHFKKPQDLWKMQLDTSTKRKLKQGYDGFCVFNKEGEWVGHYWFTLKTPPPTNISSIPQNALWVFNMFVSQNHRGHGYQKDMLVHLDSFAHQIGIAYIYADIQPENAPSIKTFLKANYQEAGVYKVAILGLRRYPFTNIKICRWNKTEKHTYKFKTW